jgi:transcriptional regulator with XRE-family HTH domain
MELKSIRKKLKFSRQDVATYLGISIHTVKAIDIGNRQVPLDQLDEKADLIKAVLNDKAHRRVAADIAPATAQQIRKIKRLHHTYSRRIDNYTRQVEKMQEDCAAASKGLIAVQQLVASLTEAGADSDRSRLRWAKSKIVELTYIIKANNQTAQELLSIEIAGLKLRVERLEKSGLME